MKFRALSREEKNFLMAYEDDTSSFDEARRATDLISEADIESLGEIVLYSKKTEICAVIAHYLNDHADDLGFDASSAVEKMARVKRSPYALNSFRLTEAEAKFVDELQFNLMRKSMEELRSVAAEKHGKPTETEFDADTERELAVECTNVIRDALLPIFEKYETRHVILAFAYLVGQLTAVQPDPEFSLKGFQKLVENQTRKAMQEVSHDGQSDEAHG